MAAILVAYRQIRVAILAKIYLIARLPVVWDTDRPREYSPQGWELHKKHLREHLENSKTAPDVFKKVLHILDHAIHDMYKIEPGSKVFVANTKMVLKGHITKKVTLFSRDQLVIGEKMKHWLPFEFGGPPGSTATPTQLFDLGYYVFETDNAKWPHMVVPKSLFEPNDHSMELQEIKKELDKLSVFKKSLTQDAQTEEDAKNIDAKASRLRQAEAQTREAIRRLDKVLDEQQSEHGDQPR